jgi:hypothetical protein
MFAWAQDNRVVCYFIAPASFCESFNGRMHDELLNESLFLGLDHGPDQDHELGCSTRAQGPQNPPRL